MKRRVMMAVALWLCGMGTTALAQPGTPVREKLLVDSLFFSEPPSELEGASYEVAILKKDDGQTMLLVKGVRLGEESRKYAIPSSQVADAAYWMEQAANTSRFLGMKIKASHTVLKEGDRIGTFSVQATDGTVWTDQNTQGKPLVLNFWYTGCGPCIREMPELSGWVDSCPGVNFLAVTWNSAEEIQDIVERRGFRFTQVAGDSVLWRMFGVQQTPTTVVLDRKGVVRKVVQGTNPQKRDALLESVKQILTES